MLITSNILRICLSAVGYRSVPTVQYFGNFVMILGLLLPAVASINLNHVVQDVPKFMGYFVQGLWLVCGLMFSLPIAGRRYQAFLLPTIVAAYTLVRADEIISEEEGYPCYSDILLLEATMANMALGLSIIYRGFAPSLEAGPSDYGLGGDVCPATTGVLWMVVVVGMVAACLDTGLVAWLRANHESYGWSRSEVFFVGLFTLVFMQGKTFLLVFILLEHQNACIW